MKKNIFVVASSVVFCQTLLATDWKDRPPTPSAVIQITLEELIDEKNADLAKNLVTTQSCTIVYHACGTCTLQSISDDSTRHEGSLREYFL